MRPHLRISDEVRQALDAGKPVLALESTIISHGFPYPANVESARECERIAREEGAIPAT
ncbi:MAG: pseudouridine-5'-phosphate glycosidase, partial [Coriobacteriia bacterium]